MNLLLSGRTEGNIERSWDWELVNKGLSAHMRPGRQRPLGRCHGATALRATHHGCLLCGTPEPYAVFGLDPAYPTYRDPALIESYHRQASDLLSQCHPCDPCSPAFDAAARVVDNAWAFLSDPDRKAVLDAGYEAIEAADRMPKRSIGQKETKKTGRAAKKQRQPSSDDDNDGNSMESPIDLDKLDRFSKFQEKTNANRIKILELEQKLSSEKLEATKLAHLTAQETKEEKKLLLEAKKAEKESKMMDAYNSLISQDTSSMSDEEKAERVAAMKCLRKAFFPETI